MMTSLSLLTGMVVSLFFSERLHGASNVASGFLLGTGVILFAFFLNSL